MHDGDEIEGFETLSKSYFPMLRGYIESMSKDQIAKLIEEAPEATFIDGIAGWTNGGLPDETPGLSFLRDAVVLAISERIYEKSEFSCEAHQLAAAPRKHSYISFGSLSILI